MIVENHLNIKEKIVSFLRIRGPSLPVHISKEINQSILFTSAFLSELFSEKRIKISNMRVGSSPLYFLPGQEPKLENFSQYLKSKEKDAFLLLKEKKFLKDSEQDPAIRVALRSIKDFAFPFKKDEEIIWRYFIVPETEYKEESKTELKKKSEETQKEEINKKTDLERFGEEKSEKIELKEYEKDNKEEIERENTETGVKKDQEEKPLLKIKEKAKKRKEKSEFVLNIIEFLKEKDMELIQEIEFKKKEFEAITRINSDLGKIEFLTIAKDKKKITENDLRVAIQKSQVNKRPILFLSHGEIHKNAKEYLSDYKNIIRFLKVQK